MHDLPDTRTTYGLGVRACPFGLTVRVLYLSLCTENVQKHQMPHTRVERVTSPLLGAKCSIQVGRAYHYANAAVLLGGLNKIYRFINLAEVEAFQIRRSY